MADRVASELAFDEVFWPAYPRKENRKDALRAWKRHVLADQIPAVMAGLERWKACEQWGRGIIPHGATWLNRGSWSETPMGALGRTAANLTAAGRTMQNLRDMQVEDS